MKKTLCKSIHEADKSLFICIENIHKVYLSSDRDIVICLKNIDVKNMSNGAPHSYEVITANNYAKLKLLYNKIIQELEEYYETQKI